jgi:hypothetical protein
MKFTIFQSDKGDCILLESDGGELMLCDGGMSVSYREHVAKAMGKLREDGRQIDVAYVSHIDQDHIAGVLALTDDEVAWRVYDHQRSIGNINVKKPKTPRPVVIRELWHNAFHEQVGQNAGSIEKMLAASAQILGASSAPLLQEIAAESRNLALSKAEAVQLSRRASTKQLGIPLNQPANGKLMMVRGKGEFIPLGNLRLFIIGPFAADLKVLRTEWNAWLKNSSTRLRDIRDKARRDEENMGNSVGAVFREMEITAETFGDRDSVTPPNLASLMFLVEEPGNNGEVRRYILTGDGHCGDIIKGLHHHNKLDQQNGKGLHVNVLKGQHHGSEHNWDEDFVKAITADHYIFCGNGENTNPEVKVVDLVIQSRIGPAASRSSNAETGKPFTLWFNSSEAAATDSAHERHMKKLRDLVAAARNKNNNVRFRFLDKSSFAFSI